jgi:hypothetical protein
MISDKLKAEIRRAVRLTVASFLEDEAEPLKNIYEHRTYDECDENEEPIDEIYDYENECLADLLTELNFDEE